MNYRQEFEQDLNRLELMRDSHDLNSLESVADDIEKKWKLIASEYYSHLMLKICDLLRSSGFPYDDRQSSLARKYAGSALEKNPETIPLEVELRLVLHLQDAINHLKKVMTDEEWASARNGGAELCFRAWQRLESEIDKDFDPGEHPELNVMPPLGVEISAGAAPEHIQDPALRAEYEAAIAKNREKAENYNRQMKLQELSKFFLPRAQQNIIDAYSTPPFNLEELRQRLSRLIADDETKARILNAVEQNILKG